MADWQSIETAPQGTLLLMCSMSATELRKSFYVDWLVDGKLCSGERRDAPTHWMTLPEPPK